ncbi:MAG TPA: YbaK/EbsC family protein [Amnibacterium sp.]|jgi:prolyl-tRNA editing enzyme YbaK/EbsC (Cys-tRNA(Pro) deacylase)|uniref:YbaK/EbsC family protein n=1 Tax=Amnibacterium sp. TaxID=1872496 RepID=UPI002F944C52
MSEQSDVPASVARVAAALEAAGANGQPQVLPASTRTAVDAAAALGCEVGAIANSLVFLADDAPLLVMTSGAHRVDTAALAERIGVGRIRRADPDAVRAATGQAIGGIAPVGHPSPLPTVVDTALAQHERIWAAAGSANSVFPTTFDELVRITNGRPTEVG